MHRGRPGHFIIVAPSGDLAAFNRGEGGRCVPSMFGDRSIKWLRRWPGLPLNLALTGGAVALGALVVIWPR